MIAIECDEPCRTDVARDRWHPHDMVNIHGQLLVPEKVPLAALCLGIPPGKGAWQDIRLLA